MGLAAPWALLLAGLAVLPVVAHLVRRRDVPEVALPTIALLERARVRSRRRARLVDLVLLALRVLVTVGASVAVAAPFATVRLAWGDGTRASVAVVIDDSLSMARGDGSGTLLAAARARAVSLLGALPPGSEASVVLAGAPARVLVPRTTDLGAARRAAEELDVAAPTRGTDVPGGVRRALRELSGAVNDARRVVVITDAARHARLDALPDPGDTGIETVVIAPRAGGDVAVVSATSIADPTRAGTAQLLVALRASGGASATGRDVRLVAADGTVLARGRVGETHDGAARATLEGATLAADGADPRATVVVDMPTGDALEADDSAGVLLRRTSGPRALVVAPSARAAADVVRALDLAPDEGGAIAREVIDPDALPAHDLAPVDVVLLLAPPALDARAVSALSRFVARGGGLVVAGGAGTDDASLRARLAALLPCASTGATTLAAAVSLRAGDPAAGDVADGAGLAAARVTTRLVLDAPPPAARVALRFDDGAPALVVADHERGRVALLATSLDESWGDLPLRPGFLPLVVRLVRALAGGAGTTGDTVLPGATVRLQPPPGATQLVVETPSGTRETLRGSATFDATLALGAYRVLAVDEAGHQRDAGRLAFVVAPPPEELDLEPAPVPASAHAARGSGHGGATVRRSLAPWAWLAVALLVLAEGVVRLRVARSLTRAAR